MGIVDFENLAKIIEDVEKLFLKYDLNTVEKDLALRELLGRLQSERRKQMTNDTVHNMDFKSIVKNFMRKQED